MQRRYSTADVFTDRPLGGNPVAVVLDAAGLSMAQMQALASEFNYSETTFVLPPRHPAHTAQVRIFTPVREVPFAGHPNVGTAFVLAAEWARRGAPVPERFTFEEAAGLVRIDLLREGDAVVGAEVTAPVPLSCRGTVAAGRAAACLTLEAPEVLTEAHDPQVVSVGLPFLVVEIASRDALRRIAPSPAAHADALPLDGAQSLYAYTHDTGRAETDIEARMFMRGLSIEDPATGSATAAVTALLAEIRGAATLTLRVGQGVDMGRPSLLVSRARREGGITTASVGGCCVAMFDGRFTLAGEEEPVGQTAFPPPTSRLRS